MALQAALSSGGVPGPTSGEGRATGGLSPAATKRGKQGVGGADRRQAAVGARTIGHRGGGGRGVLIAAHARAK
jgi:hypothetical protein